MCVCVSFLLPTFLGDQLINSGFPVPDPHVMPPGSRVGRSRGPGVWCDAAMQRCCVQWNLPDFWAFRGFDGVLWCFVMFEVKEFRGFPGTSWKSLILDRRDHPIFLWFKGGWFKLRSLPRWGNEALLDTTERCQQQFKAQSLAQSWVLFHGGCPMYKLLNQPRYTVG